MLSEPIKFELFVHDDRSVGIVVAGALGIAFVIVGAILSYGAPSSIITYSTMTVGVGMVATAAKRIVFPRPPWFISVDSSELVWGREQKTTRLLFSQIAEVIFSVDCGTLEGMRVKKVDGTILRCPGPLKASEWSQVCDALNAQIPWAIKRV